MNKTLLMIIIGEGKGQLNRKQGKDTISELSRSYSIKERATHTRECSPLCREDKQKGIGDGFSKEMPSTLSRMYELEDIFSGCRNRVMMTSTQVMTVVVVMMSDSESVPPGQQVCSQAPSPCVTCSRPPGKWVTLNNRNPRS